MSWVNSSGGLGWPTVPVLKNRNGWSTFNGVNLPIGPSADTINYGLFVWSVAFTGPVHWTEKKTKIELNTTPKDWTTSCSCTNSENFWLPVARFVEKLKNQQENRSRLVATGFSSHHVLYLTHAHIYLLVSLWIIKNGQELVEIWPKTFFYATWMYVPSVFAISQPNLNEIAWNLNQSTEN